MCSKLYGILRFSEVINLKGSDVILKETHVYQEGYWMHLSKLQSTICPIKWFRKYIEAAKIKESEEKFIFG